MTKKRILWILKLGVGVILFMLLYRQVNRGQAILDAFRSANWLNVLLCALLLIPNILLQFLKWRYILRSRFPNIRGGLAFKSLLFGSTLGFITPGNLGELARALYFKKYDKLVIAGLNFMDKLFGMIIFISFGLVAVNIIILLKFRLPHYLVLSIMVASFLFLVALWLIILNPAWVKTVIGGIKKGFKFGSHIDKFTSCFDHFTLRHSAMMLFLSFLWFVIIFFQYHLLLLAFTDAPLIPSFLAVSALLFTKIALPVSFADLGIREGAAVFYYRLFDIPQAAAFNAALLIFVINFIMPALVGSYFVFKLRWEIRQAEQVADPEQKVEIPLKIG